MGGRFDVTNPADGKVVAQLADGAEPAVQAAVRAARAAFEDGRWSLLAPTERAAQVVAWAELVAQERQSLALLDSLQMGMPMSWGADDLLMATDAVRAMGALAPTLRDELAPGVPSAMSMNLRAPHGVVGILSPWNFPTFIALQKVAAALLMGNTVVLKPSEVAPLACLRLGDLASQAGIPAGVLNVVPGLGATAGRALALHADVNALSFTGSTATGLLLMQYAGQSNLKALMLECGGKSPQVVLGDMGNLDALSDALVQGFTFNTGQVCVAGTRILVPRGLLADLQPRLIERMAALRVGHPFDEDTTVGPLASAAQHRRVTALVEAARSRGVVLHQPGTTPGGLHFPATLATGMGPDDELVQEEIFGPVAALLPFDTPEEAVALANRSRYGLAATVWSQDVAHGYRVAQQIRAGHVTVNAAVQPGGAKALHGGSEPVGMSGFGAEGGAAGLRAMTRLRSIEIHTV
jgi:acyl-CoA reductase-like NAD-dependent aldehyde dehydrogenase